MLPTVNTDNRISAANDAAVAANDENILSVLNESSSFLEEIRTTVLSDRTNDLLSLNQETLDQIRQILSNQVDSPVSSIGVRTLTTSVAPDSRVPAATLVPDAQTPILVPDAQVVADPTATLVPDAQVPTATVIRGENVTVIQDSQTVTPAQITAPGQAPVINQLITSTQETADNVKDNTAVVSSNDGKLTEIENNTQDLKSLDEIKEILAGQLELEKRAAELQRIQIENEKNARLEDMLESKRRQNVSPVETSQVLSRSEQRDSDSSSGNSFLRMLGVGVASALGSIGIIGLGAILGKQVGKFLGDNIAAALTTLGVDPAFGDAIGDVLTKNTAGVIKSFGLARLLLGRGIPGIIAFGLYKMLGLPDLTDPEVLEGVREDIVDAFGDTVAEAFDKTTDVVAQSYKGALAGGILAQIFKFKGRGKILSIVAGALIDLFDLTSLADPNKQEEIIEGVNEEFGVLATGLGIGATVLGGGIALRAARGVASGLAAVGRGVGTAGLAVAGATANAVRGGAPPAAPPAVSRQEQGRLAASKLSDVQLRDSGLQRVGQGSNTLITRIAGNKIASTDEILQAAQKTAVSKFPKLAKLLRVPGIGSLISLVDVYLIVNDETTSTREKSALLAGVLGGLGGSVLGAIVGGLVGGPFALVTAAAGGIGGYFAGAALIEHAANYLLGLIPDVDNLPPQIREEMLGQYNQELPGTSLSMGGSPRARTPSAGSFRPRSDGTQTLGERIDNPFSIRDQNQNFEGTVGSQQGFVEFENIRDGIRAADHLLSGPAYAEDPSIQTIRDVISKYAPASENDLPAYINFVSRKTRIDPDQQIDLKNPQVRAKILSAIALKESGFVISPNEIHNELRQYRQEFGQNPDLAQRASGGRNDSYSNISQQQQTASAAPSAELSLAHQEHTDLIQERDRLEKQLSTSGGSRPAVQLTPRARQQADQAREQLAVLNESIQNKENQIASLRENQDSATIATMGPPSPFDYRSSGRLEPDQLAEADPSFMDRLGRFSNNRKERKEESALAAEATATPAESNPMETILGFPISRENKELVENSQFGNVFKELFNFAEQLMPAVGTNQIADTAVEVATGSSTVVAPVVNNIITNNNSTNTSVAGGSRNMGAGTTYNIDRSLMNAADNRTYGLA